jgi:hypothetical protein
MPATETKVNLKPLGDRVVLEVLDDAEQTSGGIFIPDTAREKPQKGVMKCRLKLATRCFSLNTAALT